MKAVKREKYPLTFLDLLQVAFIVLRLCGVIRWRWLWVLAPLWGPVAVAVVLIIVSWMTSGRGKHGKEKQAGGAADVHSDDDGETGEGSI